jgi:hypothetical protein
MVNFYRRFTPGIAAVLEPLTAALKGGKKTLEWSPALDNAFQHSKQVLTAAVPLAHPAPNAAIALATDASDTHIGGPLQQQVQGSWQPLGFFSRKLQPAESKYSTFDWELLAAVAALTHLRHILAGRDFQLWTRPQAIGNSTHTCFRTMVSKAAVTPGRHRQIYWTSECVGGCLVTTYPLFAGPDQDPAAGRRPGTH